MKGFTLLQKGKLISAFRSCNDTQFNELISLVEKEKKRRGKKQK